MLLEKQGHDYKSHQICFTFFFLFQQSYKHNYVCQCNKNHKNHQVETVLVLIVICRFCRRRPSPFVSTQRG